MLKKPNAVVTLARKTGCRLTRRLYLSASSRTLPVRRPCRNETRIRTELAIATVKIMIGAETVVGLRGIPK